MTVNEVLAKNIETSLSWLKYTVDDFSDAELMSRPCDGANHANWQLGHMVVGCNFMMGPVGAKSVVLPAEFVAMYTKETASSDDAQKFASKDQLLSLMDQVYSAALEGVPVAFVSGDEELCAEVHTFDPDIATVAVARGIGAATIARHPAETREAIRNEVQHALARPRLVAPVKLPPRFDVRVVRKDARDAYRASFYPGARLVDATTVGFETTEWFEALRLLQFVTA